MNNRIYASPKVIGIGSGSSPENAVGGLPAAIEAARLIDGPVTVELAAGEYVLCEALTLDERDSGLTVIGNGAVIKGSAAVSGWTDEGDGIISANVPENLRFSRLYVNGELRERSRFPESGHILTRKIPGTENSWAAQMEPEEARLSRRQMFFTPGDFPRDLHRPEDIEFVVLQFWMEARLYPESIDHDNGEVLFVDGSWRPLTWSFGYYLDNVREGLTVPGRWYHDKGENKLYYHLKENETIDTVSIRYPVLQTLIKACPSGGQIIDSLSFEGITFAETDAHPAGDCYYSVQAELNSPNSLHLCTVHNGVFRNCTFENLGGYALWLAKGCKNWAVEDCRFSHCGAGGIRIGEVDRPKSIYERCEGVIFKNNLIADCGEFYHGAAGVWIGQSGNNSIAHNDISGPLQWAISVGWNWRIFPLNYSRANRVEKNFVHELGTGELGTHGALYVLGVSPETVIDGNYIRNVYSTPYWGAGEGIILDNSCSGVTVQNNIVTKASAGGWGCNFDCFGNVIRNNILCFGEKFQLTRYGDPPNTPNPPPNGEVFSQNIVLWSEGPLFNEKDWFSHSTFWDYNLYWCTTGDVTFMGRTLEEWNKLGLDRHSVVADPEFADAENEDFTLSDTSPALSIGFEPFSLDDVGIISK